MVGSGGWAGSGAAWAGVLAGRRRVSDDGRIALYHRQRIQRLPYQRREVGFRRVNKLAHVGQLAALNQQRAFAARIGQRQGEDRQRTGFSCEIFQP